MSWVTNKRSDFGALADGEEFDLQGFTRLCVHRGERLVEQQKLRFDRQGAGEIDALLHPARELVRKAARKIGKANEFEQRAGMHRRLATAHSAGHFETVGDVVQDIAPGQKPRLLEHHSAIGARPVDRLALKVSSPDETGKKPATAFKNVVLPHPEGPSRQTNSPRSIERSTRSMASTISPPRPA